MRPLNKTIPSAYFADQNVQTLLMISTGTYCHICESHLPDHSFATNKSNGTALEGKIKAKTWPDFLLLCDVCYKAQQSSRKISKIKDQTNSLLYPDEQLTFSVRQGQSPFVYEKKQVPVYQLDPDGKTTGKPEMTEMVIVSGTTDMARATIDHFNLNTIFYDAKEQVYRIPSSDYFAVSDLRVRQRTEIWNLVSDFTERYKKLMTIDKNSAEIMLQHGRILASGSGFWSVWATLLWEATAEPAVLSAVILPETISTQSKKAAAADQQTTDVFPGTNRNIF